jgi:phosphatidylinositol alpha-1,6-mannosyltransferase
MRVAGRSDLLPITALATVVREARQLHPDVAFHTQWQTVGASILARKITGWPSRIACAAHGRELLFNPFPDKLHLNSIYDSLRRWIISHVDAFFPVSHYTTDLLLELEISHNRIRVVPNGTDPDQFHPGGGEAIRRKLDLKRHPLLLTVGRVVRRKGIDTVLRALPAITAKIPNLTYLIAGTGPDRGRLEQIAQQLDVLDSVRFLGRVAHEDLAAHYSAADLFVMPARESRPDVEGFGLVFLEANACGTPVVGARTGGIPDAIVDGVTGTLIPPNSPDALATAIIRLMAEPAELAQLGAQGRKRVLETANWNHAANELLRHFSALK